MEASLGGSRSDSSLSSFGADSLLEVGVKAGDFLQRTVKGSSHSIAQGEGKDPVWCGQGSPEQEGQKLKRPLGMCVSAGIPGCWEGVPEDTNQEHEAELGEMLEGPAQSRTLTGYVRPGVSGSPPQGSPA